MYQWKEGQWIHFTSVQMIKFHFVSGEDEMSFYIQSLHSRKYLDVRGASKEKGAQVIINDFNGGKNQ